MARQDILRIYDKALLDVLKANISIHDKDLAKAFHVATPDRPYGFEIPTDGKGNVDSERAVLMLDTPQITLTRTKLQFDESRNNTNRVRKVRFWDGEKKFLVSSQYPKPWNIFYQIDIRTRLRNDLQETLYFLLYKPHPLKTLKCDFGYPWGTRTVTMFFNDAVDTSNLEPEESFRSYRISIPMTLETWMFEAFDRPSDIKHGATHPTDFTVRQRVVQAVKVQLVETSTNTVLSEWTETVADVEGVPTSIS